MDAARQLAQLLDGELRLLARLGDQLHGAVGVALELRLGEAERDGDGDHPLLRAVVQVALDLPPLGVRRRDDALPRIAQVVHALAQRTGTTVFRRFAGEADLAHRALQPICARRRCVSARGHRQPERAHEPAEALRRGEHDGAQDHVATVGGTGGDQLDTGHAVRLTSAPERDLTPTSRNDQDRSRATVTASGRASARAAGSAPAQGPATARVRAPVPPPRPETARARERAWAPGSTPARAWTRPAVPTRAPGGAGGGSSSEWWPPRGSWSRSRRRPPDGARCGDAVRRDAARDGRRERGPRFPHGS